ncbi:MAG TPA: hypothetical protein VHT53_06645, partial [Candidatus Elarobacter sp.]|nr:hypothetical protein [Candidatus Elarobacter sp.]
MLKDPLAVPARFTARTVRRGRALVVGAAMPRIAVNRPRRLFAGDQALRRIRARRDGVLFGRAIRGIRLVRLRTRGVLSARARGAIRII